MAVTERARRYSQSRRSSRPATSAAAAGADLNYLVTSIVHHILEQQPRPVSGLIVPGSFNPTDGTVEFADGDELANAMEEGGPLTFPRHALATTVHGMAYAPRGLERAVRIPRGGSSIIVMQHDGGVDPEGDALPPAAVDMPGQRHNEIPIAPGEWHAYHRDANGLVNGYIRMKENSGAGALYMNGGGKVRLRTTGTSTDGASTDTGGHRIIMDDVAKALTVSTTGGHTDLFDDAGRVISRVTSGGLVTKMDDVAKQVSQIAAPGVSSVVDGAAQTVTHAAGTVKTIVDGFGHTISVVVPSGGLVGLGTIASTLPASAAAWSQLHGSQFSQSFIADTLQSLVTSMAAAMVAAAAASPNNVQNFATTLQGVIAASGWVLGHITSPTIPAGSSVVRIAP